MAQMIASPHAEVKPMRLILGLIGCIGLVLTFFTLLFGFTTIPANSVGVKTRFGAYHDIVNPGLAYAIPYIDEIYIVPTQRLLKLEFGFTSPNATNIFQGDVEPAETETMITGDLNTALVPWVVQYRVTDPKMYLFGAREPEKTLRDLSESVMREVIGDRTVRVAEYRKAAEVTRRRPYLEAMQAILPGLQKKIIIDDSLKSILQTLPLLPTEQPKTSPCT